MKTEIQPVREKIIRIADDLFYKHGYNNTSFTDIADVVGISRGNFYYHFRTKDDILAAVIDYRKSIINDMLQRWNAESELPVVRLCSYVDMMVGLKEDIAQHGCPVGSVCSELIKLRNINQSNATEMISLFRDWMIAQFVSMGKDRQQAEHYAMHLLARTQGISMMANAFSDETFLLREMNQLKDWIRSLSG